MKRLKIMYGDEVWYDEVPFKIARLETQAGVLEVRAEPEPPPKPNPIEMFASAAKQRKQNEIQNNSDAN